MPSSAADLRHDATLTQGPPIHESTSPYDSYGACIATQLTPEQKSVTFSFGSFPDKTGKTNYVSDSGTGNFSTQGEDAMIATSLFKTGVRVADNSIAFKQDVDWMFSKVVAVHRAAMDDYNARVEMAKAGNQPLPPPPPSMNASLLYPDVVISGGITSFDFLPGGGFSGNVAGITLGHQQSRILVTMDAYAVLMPGAKLPGDGGQLLAIDRSEKQIVGYEDNAGGTAFFGPRDSKTFVSLDFGHRPNEAIQYAEKRMVDRLVFKLVADVFNITACNEQLQYGDSLAQLENLR
jgi:hypothetical protein